MSKEKNIKSLERFFRKCPDVLTPYGASKWMHVSKNTVYALIEAKRLPHYKYRGAYLISKADMIEYLAETTDDPPKWKESFIGKKKNEKL